MYCSALQGAIQLPQTPSLNWMAPVHQMSGHTSCNAALIGLKKSTEPI